MQLFDYDAVLPFPIETVFQQTIDLEHSPRWHPYFYHVEQTSSGTIGLGTTFRKYIRYMGIKSILDLEIVEWQPYEQVRFMGSRVAGMLPDFVITFEPVTTGTHVHYILQPDVPRIMQLPMSIVGVMAGRRDLRRYFIELEAQLSQKEIAPIALARS